MSRHATCQQNPTDANLGRGKLLGDPFGVNISRKQYQYCPYSIIKVTRNCKQSLQGTYFSIQETLEFRLQLCFKILDPDLGKAKPSKIATIQAAPVFGCFSCFGCLLKGFRNRHRNPWGRRSPWADFGRSPRRTGHLTIKGWAERSFWPKHQVG